MEEFALTFDSCYATCDAELNGIATLSYRINSSDKYLACIDIDSNDYMQFQNELHNVESLEELRDSVDGLYDTFENAVAIRLVIKEAEVERDKITGCDLSRKKQRYDIYLPLTFDKERIAINRSLSKNGPYEYVHTFYAHTLDEVFERSQKTDGSYSTAKVRSMTYGDLVMLPDNRVLMLNDYRQWEDVTDYVDKAIITLIRDGKTINGNKYALQA